MSTDDLIKQLYAHADEAESFEHAVAESAAKPLRDQLQVISRWLAARWVQDFGSLESQAEPDRLQAILAELRDRLALIAFDPTQQLTYWAERARQLGIKQAIAELKLLHPPAMDNASIGKESVLAIEKVVTSVADRIVKAQRIANAIKAGNHADVMPVIAAAHRAVSDVELASRWVTNREVNNGSSQVASALNAGRMWVSERDACLHCVAYSGVVAELGQHFPPDLTFAAKPLTPWPSGALTQPPLHPHCFPAGVIASGPGVSASTDRWYEGEMVEIRTRSGCILPVTPNHPILTVEGWVAAGLIYEGTQVIRGLELQRMLASNPDDHQQPALIEDIARSFSGACGMSTVRMPVAPEDFHGDGSYGEVDIVGTDGFLGGWIEVGQQHAQQHLSRANIEGIALAAHCEPRQVLLRIALTAPGSVRSLGVGGPLLRRSTSGEQTIGCGGIPKGYAIATQESTNSCTTNPLAVCNALDALTGLVSTDEVVCVRRFPFNGHVYNLETSGGWYTANDIIVHNCRCRITPWLGSDTDFSLSDALKREARRSVLKGWSLPTESENARLQAADRLLQQGANLPKSVEQTARTAVRRGHFRTRTVPNG